MRLPRSFRPTSPAHTGPFPQPRSPKHEALESGIYDIAVLDVMMPEMNGFEAARRARAKGVKTPIL
ncbi:MAG: hypothetical protein IKQ27_14245, partial [Lachnospiraceae bacterium]|nr:hypothetical protein [Lachnospiraceae bacterium]